MPITLHSFIPSPEQSLQEDTARLELSEKQRQAQNAGRVRGIITKYGGDLEQAQPEIMALDPELGLRFESATRAAKKSALDYQASEMEHARRTAVFLGETLGAAKNETDWQAGLYAAKRANLKLPPQFDHFDQGLADHLNEQAKSSEQRAQLARAQFQRDTQREAQKETARRDAAKEAADAKKPLKGAAGDVFYDPQTFKPLTEPTAKPITNEWEAFMSSYPGLLGKKIWAELALMFLPYVL